MSFFEKTIAILLMLVSGLGLPSAVLGQSPQCDSQSDKKLALVIGNSYSGANQVSGEEDGRVMAEYLCQIGFSVTSVPNGKLKAMREALQALKPKVVNAEKVVFFFSGHGYQINGVNYLLPQDFTTIDPDDPQLSLKEVFRSLGGKNTLVLLDACRLNSDLPVKGGKTLKEVDGWRAGLVEPTQPQSMAIGFATDYGQPAQSGADGFSPYTSALLRSIREPGLTLGDLFARVKEEVRAGTGEYQNPQSKGLENVLKVTLRDAVEIPAVIPDGPYSDLLVFLNGELVLDSTQKPQGRLRLKAGENDLLLLVSNGKTYHNGHTWETTEGWSYRLDLMLPANDQVEKRIETFQDHEDAPFKDGPHHGKVFAVARAKINVDPAYATTTLPAATRQDKIWNTGAGVPPWARDQKTLYEKKVTELPLGRILDPTAVGDFGLVPGELIFPLLRELLSTGKLLGQQIADPTHTIFTIHGNNAYKDWVTACVDGRLDERINDLRASVSAALKRKPRPFDSFDQALSHCVQEVAGNAGVQLSLEDSRVWTALEDRSQPTPEMTVGVAHE
ncbi:MAG: caspase family protein [Thermoanaerobaculia bacterium]